MEAEFKFPVELHLFPQEGELLCLMLSGKRACCFQTFCSEQLNQSDVCIPAHSKSPGKYRLNSSEKCQLHILNNIYVQQPAANSYEDKVKVQTFLFPYRVALVSVAADRRFSFWLFPICNSMNEKNRGHPLQNFHININYKQANHS